MEDKNKKKWLVLGVLFPLLLGGFIYLVWNQLVTKKTEPKPPITVNLIDSLEEFVSLIKFYDNRGITMSDASGFFYSHLDSENNLEGGILSFNPRTFYEAHIGDEAQLRGALRYLAKTKLLLGLQGSDQTLMPPILKTHDKLHRLDVDKENTFNTTKEKRCSFKKSC